VVGLSWDEAWGIMRGCEHTDNEPRSSTSSFAGTAGRSGRDSRLESVKQVAITLKRQLDASNDS